MNLKGGEYRKCQAWISSAAPNTAVERVGRALTEDLRQNDSFRKVHFNKLTGFLEEQAQSQPPIRLARGFTSLGKSTFLLSLKNRLPEYGASFVDTQNLAFLAPPRSCIFVYDIFYLTHPSTKAEYFQGQILYRHLNSYDAVLTDSHYTKTELIKYDKVDANKIHVFHLDVDRNVFFPGTINKSRLFKEIHIPEKSQLILHVSSGEKRKNFSGILHAFALLAKENPDLILVKAGKDLSPKNQLHAEALAKDLGILSRVRFLGRVDDFRLTELYRAADCFVFPSFAEGFGLPVLEAQACGCPVVTSNVTSLPEVSGPLCRAVSPHDIPSLAEAISYTVNDRGIRERLALANHAFLKGFSWNSGRDFLREFFARHGG